MMRDAGILVRTGSEAKLYAQIANRMRRRIREREWQVGSKLPSLEKLCDEFSVSLITIRKAVEVLESEGLLERRHGSGTFVTSAVNAREWLRLETSWNEILKAYELTDPKVFNRMLAKRAGCKLTIAQPYPVVDNYQYMRRAHIIDGLPYGVTDVYLASDIYKLAPEEFDRDMVIRVLARHPEIQTGEVFQTITIGTSVAEDAEILQIATGSPVGELLRTATDTAGRLVYWANTTYRGDLVRVVTRLK